MKIFIDPGHGGMDRGAVYGSEEADLNLMLAYFLNFSLKSKGFKEVMLSRTGDGDLDLKQRTDKANDWGADLFVSLHANAADIPDPFGTEVFVAEKASGNAVHLAQLILESWAAFFPNRKIRGLKRKNFYVLRNTIMPAVLVETEFLSNPEARAFLKDPGNQVLIALVIARAIERYSKEV